MTHFGRISLAALPLLLGAGFNGGCTGATWGSCPDVTTTFAISQTDAGSGDGGIDDLIARCQASSSDCLPLCEQFAQDIMSCQLVTSDGGALALRIVAPGSCD